MEERAGDEGGGAAKTQKGGLWACRRLPEPDRCLKKCNVQLSFFFFREKNFS
jgi:hypothetical protein